MVSPHCADRCPDVADSPGLRLPDVYDHGMHAHDVYDQENTSATKVSDDFASTDYAVQSCYSPTLNEDFLGFSTDYTADFAGHFGELS